MKKLLSIIICYLALSQCYSANAQAYSAGTIIYQYKSRWYILVEFNGKTTSVGTGGVGEGYSTSKVKAGFRESPTWADDAPKNRGTFYLDEEKSTSSRWVYKQNRTGSGNWDKFLAVSKDLSTMIIWAEDDYGRLVDGWGGGQANHTSTCVRVDPEIFKPEPQSNKYDFLND